MMDLFLFIRAFSIILVCGDIKSSFAATITVQCSGGNRYRTFDGSCNNLDHPTWGKASTAQRRFIHPTGSPMVEYENGIDEPRGGIKSKLSSPRLISNLISKAEGVGNQLDKKRSGMVMSHGQLLAHDILKTPLHTETSCCDPKSENYQNNDICFNFDIPADDTTFKPGCKSFSRAKKAIEDNDLPAYRENINLITSYIDASFLYGSSEAEVRALRDGNSYLLKTDDNGLLPTTPGGGCVYFQGKCPLAGDTRVHEAPSLGVTHILWVREHNRIATILDEMSQNVTLFDTNNGTFYQETREDIIFQETRRIIIAMVQHISFNHYLPAILDDVTMRRFNLYSKSFGRDETYDSNVDVSVRNGFGTAPFRFGHAHLTSHQCMLHKDFKTLEEHPIEETLKDPKLYYTNNGTNVQDIARWLAFKPANKINGNLVDGVRNKLFTHSESPAHDLFALNIQRGRDQGTPGYNKWRHLCGLRYKTFEDFGNYSDILSSLYNTPDDIDFYVGGLLEKGPDGGVGETFACVIAMQFQLLKIGDRFWYERPDTHFSFSEEQVNAIKQGTSLAKIYCRAFNLTRIHKDIFMSSPGKSYLVDCDELPDVDLSLFVIGSGTDRFSAGFLLTILIVIVSWVTN